MSQNAFDAIFHVRKTFLCLHSIQKKESLFHKNIFPFISYPFGTFLDPWTSFCTSFWTFFLTSSYLDLIWRSFGPLLDLFWTPFGLFWNSFGPLLDLFWTFLDLIWTSFRLFIKRNRRMKLFWTYFEPLSAHSLNMKWIFGNFADCVAPLVWEFRAIFAKMKVCGWDDVGKESQ